VSRKLAAWLALVGTLAALNYSSRLTQGKPPRDALYQYSVAVGGLILYAIVLGIVLWIARGLSREQLGLRRPVSWINALWLALGLIVLVFIVEAALEPLLHATREQGLEPPHWNPHKEAPFALNAAVVVIAAPLVEELTFRGLGYALLLPYGVFVAIVGTAIAFAGAHGLVAGFPALLIFGLAIAVLRWRTKSVFPGMLFHATFNGAALILAFVR
jgi:membrane protease YdiL (CAAX protease family)